MENCEVDSHNWTARFWFHLMWFDVSFNYNQNIKVPLKSIVDRLSRMKEANNKLNFHK